MHIKSITIFTICSFFIFLNSSYSITINKNYLSILASINTTLGLNCQKYKVIPESPIGECYKGKHYIGISGNDCYIILDTDSLEIVWLDNYFQRQLGKDRKNNQSFLTESEIKKLAFKYVKDLSKYNTDNIKFEKIEFCDRLKKWEVLWNRYEKGLKFIGEVRKMYIDPVDGGVVSFVNYITTNSYKINNNISREFALVRANLYIEKIRPQVMAQIENKIFKLKSVHKVICYERGKKEYAKSAIQFSYSLYNPDDTIFYEGPITIYVDMENGELINYFE